MILGEGERVHIDWREGDTVYHQLLQLAQSGVSFPPCSPNGAVLALQSSLCFKESSEADMAAYYSSDAGIAFWLLGRSYRLLHNHREAARHFRSCLKFNPFLWTAFEALTSMGERLKSI